MQAIALKPGTQDVHMIDRPEPKISAPDEIKLKIVRVGICGTDREEASGGRARGPDGEPELVIGHEMFGQVVEVGQDVRRVKAGDYAVFTVRRGCGRCPACRVNRPDGCRTGDFRERGIWRLDGYETEYVIDHAPYVVPVPPELEAEGVLTEPLSVVEKALDVVARVQRARVSGAGLAGRRCLVAGLGPVGLLAAMLLRLRGAEILGLDVVDAGSARPLWLAGIGGRYVDGRDIPVARLADSFGPLDLVVEASGVPEVAADLPLALRPGGACVLTGIPRGHQSIPIPESALLRRLVLANLLVVGSVSAALGHFQMAVADLARARRRWGEHLVRLITHRRPFTEFGGVLVQHPPDEIKTVLEWAAPVACSEAPSGSSMAPVRHSPRTRPGSEADGAVATRSARSRASIRSTRA